MENNKDKKKNNIIAPIVMMLVLIVGITIMLETKPESKTQDIAPIDIERELMEKFGKGTIEKNKQELLKKIPFEEIEKTLNSSLWTIFCQRWLWCDDTDSKRAKNAINELRGGEKNE